ncbi:MAG: FAD-dependent thymidylate synthase [Planctomycetota bacterium]|nr:FAD-dependent thymidylate synthase [Planctomycetota bacterium]
MKIDVLDRGFVRLVETHGSGDAGVPEAGIIEAARQSTQGSFRGWERDKRLLRYLYVNKHSTPFEFAGMTLEVKAPVFVFRQWHRHRTQSYNEMSARYGEVPLEFYVPTVDRVMADGGANKQAGAKRGARALTEGSTYDFVWRLECDQASTAKTYLEAIESGVPKELARLALPVSRYTQMRATANLRNWLGFLTLRLDPHAQWEIRQYAEAVYTIITEQFPHTAALFEETR